MALTQPGQRLVLTYVGHLPKALIELATREFVIIEG
jgi:hypothetical protein